MNSILVNALSSFSWMIFTEFSESWVNLPFTPVNSYLTRCSWENLHFATTSWNISDISYSVSLVTLPLLDLFIFHWIQWKSFRKNSISNLKLQRCYYASNLKVRKGRQLIWNVIVWAFCNYRPTALYHLRTHTLAQVDTSVQNLKTAIVEL